MITLRGILHVPRDIVAKRTGKSAPSSPTIVSGRVGGGVVMIIVDCVAHILLDRRLMARYAFARRLRSLSANADLKA